MNERHWYLRSEPAPSLHMWVLGKMTTGAMYGAVAFFGVIAFILIIRIVAGFLPPESQEAVDPSASLFVAPEPDAARTA